VRFISQITHKCLEKDVLQNNMFCTRCSAQNSDEAAFCEKCGNPLKADSTGAQPQPSSYYPPSSPSSHSATSRSPIIAAILNLFFGVGYLYLGYKRVLGIQTILFVVILLVVYAILGFFTFGILSLIIAVILAIDGYQKAEGQKGFISAEL
jgi:ribosomal protein L40E